MKTLFLTFALAATTLHADGTVDLRAALAKFPGHDPLRATIAIESEDRSDDADAKPEPGRGSIEVNKGADGLHVTYAPDVIGRAEEEARANENDPEKPTPTVRALRELDAVTIMEVLDAAGVLSRYLDNAKLQKDVSLPNNGKPYRQLTFAVQPKLSKSDAKHVKTATMTLVVNLGADGIPFSAEMKKYIKIKILLISVEQNAQEIWTFGRAGDNLIATRHHETQSGSGFGQKVSGTKTMTVVVR